MALASYQILTQALLQAPSSPIPLIANATLTQYINEARQQVAAQGACIRNYATLALVVGQRIYGFSAVTGLQAGVGGINRIRQLWWSVPGGAGQKWVPSRPFEYFGLYALNKSPPTNGSPAMWAQFAQGQAGSIFIDPLPDLAYACLLDVVGEPIDLVDDTTVEAIPPIWTLAVPFYAAWFGFMSAQRQADADMMMKRFQEQMALARNAANPDLLPENWSQAPDAESANRLGMTGAAR